MADDPNLKRDVPEEVVAAGAVVNVTEYLKGIQFPVDKEGVERYAREHGADRSALAEIGKLPDRRFEDPGQLIRAIGDEVAGL